jgi:hypothetical protein
MQPVLLHGSRLYQTRVMTILSGTAGAPLIATREYTFFARDVDAPVVWMTTSHRGTWDDFGEAERKEQETWMWAFVRGLGITTVPPDYPGNFGFADRTTLERVWSALSATLVEPPAAPPTSTRTRTIAATDLGARYLELVRRVIGCHLLERSPMSTEAREAWHRDGIWARIERSDTARAMTLDPRYQDPRDVRVVEADGVVSVTVTGVLDADTITESFLASL